MASSFGQTDGRGRSFELRARGFGFGEKRLQVLRGLSPDDRRLLHREPAVHRRAHEAVELCAENRRVAVRLDRALAKVGHVYRERQHVGLSHRAGVASSFGARHVFARGLEGAVHGTPPAFDAQQLSVGPRDVERQDSRHFFHGRVGRHAAATGGVHTGADPSAVEEQLFEAEGAMKESGRARMIQRVNREIRRRELTRRQQGTEDEDGLIAPLPRFGDRHPREEPRPRIVFPGGRFVRAGSGGRERPAVLERVTNRTIEGEDVLAGGQLGAEGEQKRRQGGTNGHMCDRFTRRAFGDTGRFVTKRADLHLLGEAANEKSAEYAKLVRAAAGGDREGMERLLMRAQEAAFRFSLLVCGHVEDAEDVMQDALLKTYRHVGRIREPEAFRTWLYRTVRNACLMKRRRRVGEPAHFESTDAGDEREEGRAAAVDVADRAPGPDELALNSWLGERLRTALGSLPARYRVIVVLREMEGLSTREVATVTGISEANVKTRLHRARVLLKERLEGV